MSKREREYTPEEALAITLNETTPHWYRSPPLLVGVVLDDRAYPQPLDAAVQSGTWIFFFVSATSPAFGQIFARYREWIRRFRGLGLEFVLVFRGRYPYFRERKTIEAWLGQLDFGTIAVCDANGALARAFGVAEEPGIAILREGAVALADSSADWSTRAETYLHGVLRENSPGLPLWPVFSAVPRLIRETHRWPLHVGAPALAEGNPNLELVGRWTIEDDRIFTDDPAAEIRLHAPGPAVNLVARSLSDEGDPTRIWFDSEGASFADSFGGADFSVDDSGHSGTVLSLPRAYAILRQLSPGLRRLRFRFPYAKVSPVGIYALEFGDPSDS